MTELRASTAELAEVRSLLPDDDATHHYYHGEMKLLMRRWAEAERHLARARAMVIASEDPSESLLLSINAMLMWAYASRVSPTRKAFQRRRWKHCWRNRSRWAVMRKRAYGQRAPACTGARGAWKARSRKSIWHSASSPMPGPCWNGPNE